MKQGHLSADRDAERGSCGIGSSNVYVDMYRKARFDGTVVKEN